MFAPVLHQLGHMVTLSEGKQSRNEWYVEKMASGAEVSMGIMTTEARFLALRTFVQVLVGSSITDVRVYTTVIPYWIDSSKFPGTRMESVR